MIDEIREFAAHSLKDPEVTSPVLREILRSSGLSDAYRSTAAWLHFATGSVFLQDADALVPRPFELEQILRAVHRLPDVRRITTYSRLSTCARLGLPALSRLRASGLNRIHAGMESGSDTVLEHVRKGINSEKHVRGGLAVKQAGIELSLYIMPGLGGRRLSKEHARESARIVSIVEPDTIRLRSLAVVPGTPLYEQWRNDRFDPLSETELILEIKDFLLQIRVTRGRLESDHGLNLLPDLEGDLPDGIDGMINQIDRVLNLPGPERILFILGRRAGFFENTDDMKDDARRQSVQQILEILQHQNVDPETAAADLAKRLI